MGNRPGFIASLYTVLWLLGLAIADGCSRDPQQLGRKYMASADAYMAKGQHQEAIVQYRNVVAAVPASVEGHVKLADAYARQSDFENAVREYVRAADLRPDAADLQLKAGRFLLLAGRFEEARSRAELALRTSPRNVDAHILQGDALGGLKDLDGAIKEIEEAIESDPTRSLVYSNLGELRLAAGDRDQAERAFRKAVELDPTSVPARLALANYLWSVGRFDEVERLLKEALSLDARNVLINRSLAAFYINSKRPAEAERFLKAAAEASANASPKLLLADYYVRQRKPHEALLTLQAIADRPEVFAPARARIATIEYDSGHKVEGHRAIDSVLERDGRNANALIVKGRFLLREMKFDEALARLTAAATADPRLPAAHYWLGVAYERTRDDRQAIRAFEQVLALNPNALNAKIRLASLYRRKGDTALALQLAQSVRKEAPRHAAARLELAEALVARGDLRGAESELRTVVSAAPGFAPGQAALGRLYLIQKHPDQAKGYLTKAIQIDPDSLQALSGLIGVSFLQKRPDEARSLIDTRLSRTPNDPAALLLAASTYHRLGDLAKVETYLKQTVQSGPGYLEAYGLLAQLYISQRRLDEARADFEELARRQPRAVAPATMVGIILEAQRKTADARKQYERVLAIDPEAAVAANNLASLYTQDGGNLEIALQLAQTAKSKLPDRAEVNDTLGWIYYRKGLPGLAVDPLRQSVDRDPKNAVYHYHLGLAYRAVGEAAKAEQSLMTALELKPDFDSAVDARKALDELRTARVRRAG